MKDWRWKKFAALDLSELYDILTLRQRVFIVEQKCAYLDCDGLDSCAWHLSGYRDGQLSAYLRVLPPKTRFAEMSLGRVITAPQVRGAGLGVELTSLALQKINEHFGDVPLRISAQAYLQRFYEKFGFKTVGEVYLEDDIPHIEMYLAARG